MAKNKYQNKEEKMDKNTENLDAVKPEDQGENNVVDGADVPNVIDGNIQEPNDTKDDQNLNDSDAENQKDNDGDAGDEIKEDGEQQKDNDGDAGDEIKEDGEQQKDNEGGKDLDSIEQQEVIIPAVGLTDEEELNRIESLISNLELDTAATLEAISKSSIPLFSILAAKLIDYRDQMHYSKGLMETKVGAGKNIQLYKSIMNILGNKDERYFRVGFALINVVFKTYNESNDSFNKYNLTRYDLGWDNQKDLATYNKLVTVIPMLADATTREAEKVKIDFDKLRDKVKTNFTDLIVDRLVSFYNV